MHDSHAEQIVEIFLRHQISEDDIRHTAYAIRTGNVIRSPKNISDALWQIANWIEEQTSETPLDETNFTKENADEWLDFGNIPNLQELNIAEKERQEGANHFLHGLIERIARIVTPLAKDNEDITHWLEDAAQVLQENGAADIAPIISEPENDINDDMLEDNEPTLTPHTDPGDTIDSAILYAHSIITKIQMHRISGMNIPKNLDKQYHQAINIIKERLN